MFWPFRVALRKESVDRNSRGMSTISYTIASLSARRAWIEIKYVVKDSDFSGSLSARRAWIEIGNSCTQSLPEKVALRKESVDRNLSAMQIVIVVVESLSARRAWIEISVQCRL